MPIPLIVLAGAAVAGVAGAANGAYGGVKIVGAKGREKAAKAIHEESVKRFETVGEKTNASMDRLGMVELEIIQSFEDFSDVIEMIQNRPQFGEFDLDGIDLPDFDSAEFKRLFIAAKAFLGGLSSAAAGIAGGVAASGATTAIVAAFGTASTGTAISTLSGAAATNAVLAALGGGSLAAGGGGMALGSVVLGATAGAAALLVGGVIVNAMGHKISKDAEEFEGQVIREKENIDEACILLEEIASTANEYRAALEAVNRVYIEKLDLVRSVVIGDEKTDWGDFDASEKLLVQNLVLLVGMLYSMCKVNLVIDDDDDGVTDRVNSAGVDDRIRRSSELLASM